MESSGVADMDSKGEILPGTTEVRIGSGGEKHKTRTSLGVLLVIFSVSVIIMAAMLMNFPELNEEDFSRLRFPRSLEAAKELGQLLSKYKDTHYYTVLVAITVTYIFYNEPSLQTFAIPGSIFFSILSGFLFPFPLALVLVCLGLMRKHFHNRLESWQAQTAHHHDNMIWYIIFLRITPFLPNWFINLAAPVIGVKLMPFFVGTFIGVAPPSFFFIRAGTTLYALTTATGHVSIQSLSILAVMATLSLLPVLFKKVLKKKME